jgi:hypothetical protein
VAGRIRSIEKSNNLIRNQTCDLRARSIVQQPTNKSGNLNLKNILAKQENVTEKGDWGTLVPEINIENCIKLGFLSLYIKIQTLLKHYYMYSTSFIEITHSV